MNKKLSDSVRVKLKFLIMSQYWSYDQLRNHQWQKLEKLVKHAYKNVSYYKEIFDKNGLSIKKIQSFDDLKLLPLLTKNDIKQNLDRMIDKNVDKNCLFLNYTGGSTGEPLKFYQDKNYLEWAEAARIRNWKYFPGYKKNEKEAILWGADRDISNILTVMNIAKILIKKQELALNTFNITNIRMRKFVFLFNLIKPKLLRGYASSLVFFCNYLHEHNLELYPPEKVISTAELLTEKDRYIIEKTLKTKVLNSYGCREVSQIAMECEFQKRFHIVMENQYVEIKDGKIIVTNLNNFAMPFIRYEIGDKGNQITETKCECGRGLVGINSIEGRTNDTISFDGKSIHPQYIILMFNTNTKISRFQIIKNENKGLLKILVDKEDKVLENKIKINLKRKFPTTKIYFIVTENFIKTRTGKLKFVIDEDEYENHV